MNKLRNILPLFCLFLIAACAKGDNLQNAYHIQMEKQNKDMVAALQALTDSVNNIKEIQSVSKQESDISVIKAFDSLPRSWDEVPKDITESVRNRTLLNNAPPNDTVPLRAIESIQSIAEKSIDSK